MFTDLPELVLFLICSFLDHEDLLSLKSSCGRMYHLVTSRKISRIAMLRCCRVKVGTSGQSIISSNIWRIDLFGSTISDQLIHQLNQQCASLTAVNFGYAADFSMSALEQFFKKEKPMLVYVGIAGLEVTDMVSEL